MKCHVEFLSTAVHLVWICLLSFVTKYWFDGNKGLRTIFQLRTREAKAASASTFLHSFYSTGWENSCTLRCCFIRENACENADVLNHFHKDLRKLRQSTKFWCLRQDIFLINLTDVTMKFPNWLLPYLNMNKMSCLNMEHKLSEQEMRDIKFQKKCCKISTLICILWYLFPFPWKKIYFQS